MKKFKKNIICILAICCVFISFTTADIKAYSISKNDFKALSVNEDIVGHTSIGTWNSGSFFETITMEVVGRDNSTGYEKYRFRHYITHRGNTGSYIYQVTPVGIYLDGKQVAKLSTNKKTSNKTDLWGEATVSVAPGLRVFELRDINTGAITQVNIKRTINIRLPKYTVNFVDYNGTLLKSQMVELSKNATPPPNPSLTGHTFTGWNGSYMNITNDRTITAQYNMNNYTVNFVDYNGTLLKSQSVTYGGSASPPANPSLVGHTFTGWNGSYTNVVSNRTITASYKINTYTIRFDSNGGSSVAPRVVTYGDKVGRPGDPLKGSDKFVGWFRDNTLLNTFDFNERIMRDMTLFAKWDAIPTLIANDITIFKGLYTREEWQRVRLESVQANDKEDGDIRDKVIVTRDTTDLEAKGTYEIDYRVSDRAGNIVDKTVNVVVLDEVEKSIRSISLEFRDTLTNDSNWKMNEYYFAMLNATLEKNDTEAKEVWVLDVTDIEKIKAFNATHDYSKRSNQLFKEQFGYLKKETR